MDIERQVVPLIFTVTGAANVLLIKWSDILQGECNDGKWRSFQHPILQTALMFLGQLICFIVYKLSFLVLQRRRNASEDVHLLTRGGREFSPLSLLLPALLDTIASVLLFTGLYLTYASSFQIIRGSIIIFVGIFSSIYLNQPLRARHWMAIFTIACSVITILSIDVERVYYDKATLTHADPNAILTGNLLVLVAQVFHAAQYVYEEKHLRNTEMPALQATGWQGIFGLAITAILAVCMNFLPTSMPFVDNSRGVFDDLTDVFLQLRSNSWLIFALSMFIVSCAFYNYAALNIVKFSSTTNCVMADCIRIFYVWLMALLLEWETLNLISCMGFIVLIMGLISYRNAIFLEWYRALLAHLQFRRYAEVGDDSEQRVPSRPADVI